MVWGTCDSAPLGSFILLSRATPPALTLSPSSCSDAGLLWRQAKGLVRLIAHIGIANIIFGSKPEVATNSVRLIPLIANGRYCSQEGSHQIYFHFCCAFCSPLNKDILKTLYYRRKHLIYVWGHAQYMSTFSCIVTLQSVLVISVLATLRVLILLYIMHAQLLFCRSVLYLSCSRTNQL